MVQPLETNYMRMHSGAPTVRVIARVAGDRVSAMADTLFAQNLRGLALDLLSCYSYYVKSNTYPPESYSVRSTYGENAKRAVSNIQNSTIACES